MRVLYKEQISTSFATDVGKNSMVVRWWELIQMAGHLLF